MRDHDAQSEDFASFRVVMSDKLSAELEQEFAEVVGADIHEGYGMTEVGTSHINPPSGANKLGSVGTLNTTYSSSIRDEDGNEVPVETEGRHWMAGPTVMIGSWDDPEATAATIRDGWLDSGDILKVDADELREGADRPTSQDVIQFARARVGYKAPEVIIVLDAMPLTATGKVDRVTLKRMAADQLGAAHPE